MTPQRFETQENATIEIYGKPQVIHAEMKNLSMTGACVVWPQEHITLQPGDLIRLTITLKSLNRQRNVSAEVVWCEESEEGTRSGVRFIPPEMVVEKITSRLS